MFDKFIIYFVEKNLRLKQNEINLKQLSLQVSEMIEIMQGLPDNFIGVIYSGTVTGKDYDDVLIPVFKEKLNKYGKLRLLYQINTGISHFSWSSYMEDAKVS